MSDRGVPTAAELAHALREALREDVLPETDGRAQFLVRVAAHVAGMLERELAHGADVADAHARRLAELGVTGDAELVERIRAGAFDDRTGELVAALRASAADRLRVVNPRYL